MLLSMHLHTSIINYYIAESTRTVVVSRRASFAPWWRFYVTPPDTLGHSRFRSGVYLCGRPRVRAGWPGGPPHSPHSAECGGTGFMM